MILVDDDCPTATCCRAGRGVSGASETWPMERMTGTVAGLGCVPRSSCGGLYGHALSFFSDPVAQRNGSRQTSVEWSLHDPPLCTQGDGPP